MRYFEKHIKDFTKEDANSIADDILEHGEMKNVLPLRKIGDNAEIADEDAFLKLKGVGQVALECFKRRKVLFGDQARLSPDGKVSNGHDVEAHIDDSSGNRSPTHEDKDHSSVHSPVPSASHEDEDLSFDHSPVTSGIPSTNPQDSMRSTSSAISSSVPSPMERIARCVRLCHVSFRREVIQLLDRGGKV